MPPFVVFGKPRICDIARWDLCPFVAERDIALDTECQQTATGYNQDLTR